MGADVAAGSGKTTAVVVVDPALEGGHGGLTLAPPPRGHGPSVALREDRATGCDTAARLLPVTRTVEGAAAPMANDRQRRRPTNPAAASAVDVGCWFLVPESEIHLLDGCLSGHQFSAKPGHRPVVLARMRDAHDDPILFPRSTRGGPMGRLAGVPPPACSRQNRPELQDHPGRVGDRRRRGHRRIPASQRSDLLVQRARGHRSHGGDRAAAAVMNLQRRRAPQVRLGPRSVRLGGMGGRHRRSGRSADQIAAEAGSTHPTAGPTCYLR